MFERYDERCEEPEIGVPRLFAAEYNQILDELDLTITRGASAPEQLAVLPEAAPIVASDGRHAMDAGRIGTGSYVAQDRPTLAADEQRALLPRSSVEADLFKLSPAARAALEDQYQQLLAEMAAQQQPQPGDV